MRLFSPKLTSITIIPGVGIIMEEEKEYETQRLGRSTTKPCFLEKSWALY